MWQTSWQRKHSMHLRNSWMRSTSICCMTSGRGASARGVKGGILAETRKFHETSVTRSLISGKVLSGWTTIGAPPTAKSRTRALQSKRGLPLISALHEPHLPALQFQRQESVLSWLAWIWWMASSTTMPGNIGTWYSRSSPPLASPRKTRRVTVSMHEASFDHHPSLFLLKQRGQLGRHRRHRAGRDLHRIAVLDGHQVLVGPLGVRVGIVRPPLRAPAFAALQGTAHDNLRDLEHVADVAGGVPAGVVQAGALDMQVAGALLQGHDLRQALAEALGGAGNHRALLHRRLQLLAEQIGILGAGRLKRGQQRGRFLAHLRFVQLGGRRGPGILGRPLPGPLAEDQQIT